MIRSSRRTVRLDLHTHTRGSWDCLSDPEQLLARARVRGIDRIAITDHNRLDVALEMARVHPDSVIAGEEIKTAEGIDVIGLYLHNEIPGGTGAREVCRLIREDGGVVYLPHPYASGKGGGGRYAEMLAPLVDVVEVFNARLFPRRRNAPADRLARSHGKHRGAGSDAHSLGEVGNAWVEAPAHENRAELFLEALAYSVVRGRSSPLHLLLAPAWAKLRKAFPGRPR